jgi:hypothetical protein
MGPSAKTGRACTHEEQVEDAEEDKDEDKRLYGLGNLLRGDPACSDEGACKHIDIEELERRLDEEDDKHDRKGAACLHAGVEPVEEGGVRIVLANAYSHCHAIPLLPRALKGWPQQGHRS